ncbi:unnamed protein product [Alopecurus aequalis]
MAPRKELEAPPLEGDLAMGRLSQENSSDPKDDDDKWGCMLPLFCDSKEELYAADAAREARKRRPRRRHGRRRRRSGGRRRRNGWRRWRPSGEERSTQRSTIRSTSTIPRPTPVLAMRYTDTQTSGRANLKSINVLSVKIVSSDKGFPLDVYGNIILRDSLDYKCIYLFSRPSIMDSELIKSEDQSLILTGPSRGLFLVDYIYIEVDLKMRDPGKDKQLSIGLLDIDGRLAPRFPTSEVQCCTLESSLSTVEVRYAVVEKATEATVEFQVLEGDFKGKITGHTTKIEDSTHDRMLLHDSRACGAATSSDGTRVIQLLRRVVAVCVDEMLVFTVIPEGSATRVERFAPFLHGAQEGVFDWGAIKLRVTVYWSVISY